MAAFDLHVLHTRDGKLAVSITAPDGRRRPRVVLDGFAVIALRILLQALGGDVEWLEESSKKELDAC